MQDLERSWNVLSHGGYGFPENLIYKLEAPILMIELGHEGDGVSPFIGPTKGLLHLLDMLTLASLSGGVLSCLKQHDEGHVVQEGVVFDGGKVGLEATAGDKGPNFRLALLDLLQLSDLFCNVVHRGGGLGREVKKRERSDCTHRERGLRDKFVPAEHLQRQLLNILLLQIH